MTSVKNSSGRVLGGYRCFNIITYKTTFYWLVSSFSMKCLSVLHLAITSESFFPPVFRFSWNNSVIWEVIMLSKRVRKPTAPC